MTKTRYFFPTNGWYSPDSIIFSQEKFSRIVHGDELLALLSERTFARFLPFISYIFLILGVSGTKIPVCWEKESPPSEPTAL